MIANTSVFILCATFRNCGLVFCGTCSEKRLPLPEEQLYDPVRVCFACFEKLVTLQERENERTENEGTLK